MKVLSLYDGISCGMVALERSGISIENYDAFEIDKYAIQISQKNYPQIIHHGDVFNGNYTEFKGYDLLLGGSPCTFWSIAKTNRETTPDGMGGKLFLEYVRALRESECRFFLYENNYSIHRDIKAFISEQLGTEPITINSALLSAQQRRRCYWTNIPNVSQPKDRGILLKSILESGEVWQDKSYCVTASYRPSFESTLEKHRHTLVAINADGEKARTLKAQYAKSGLANAVRKDGFGASMVAAPVDINHCTIKNQQIYSVKNNLVTISPSCRRKNPQEKIYKIDLPDGDYIIRKLTPIEAERLQTLPDDYTAGISQSQRYKCIGNGWTVDVIAHILKGLRE